MFQFAWTSFRARVIIFGTHWLEAIRERILGNCTMCGLRFQTERHVPGVAERIFREALALSGVDTRVTIATAAL